MEGGFTPDALVDMSGGVEEKFSLKELFKSKTNCEIDKFWAILLRARKKKSVICCLASCISVCLRALSLL